MFFFFFMEEEYGYGHIIFRYIPIKNNFTSINMQPTNLPGFINNIISVWKTLDTTDVL